MSILNKKFTYRIFSGFFVFLDYKLTKLRHINKTFLLLLPVESALLNFSTESLLILPTTYFPLKKTVQKVSLKHSEKPKRFNEWSILNIYTCKPKIDNQIFFLVSLVGSWWNKPETFGHFGTRHFLFFSIVPDFFNFFRRGLLESSLVNFAFPLCNAFSWAGVMGTKPLGLICYE